MALNFVGFVVCVLVHAVSQVFCWPEQPFVTRGDATRITPRILRVARESSASAQPHPVPRPLTFAACLASIGRVRRAFVTRNG